MEIFHKYTYRRNWIKCFFNFRDSIYDFYLEDSLGPINMKELLDMGAILFPYKVAKALDPDIYRNIDFDNWVDTLRGITLFCNCNSRVSKCIFH